MNHDSHSAHSNAADEERSKTADVHVPIFLIILFALVFYWAMVYVNDHGGGFSTDVYWPYRDHVQLKEVQPVEGPGPILRKIGQRVYKDNCMACHQENGMGSTANGCPPLPGSEWVIDGGPNRLIRIVLYGAQGPISVLGKQYPGTTAMTPFANLTDEQIAGVLTYIRSEWENKAEYVKPEKVAEIRQKEKDAGFTGYRNAAELLKIPDKD